MTPFLLNFIIDPVSNEPLHLIEPTYDEHNNIQTGILVSSAGNRYPIINGIPRFCNSNEQDAVTSFGDQWNYFNFIHHKESWLAHTVKNTFGSPDAFKGKLIIDAGGGSGAQTRWFSENGASHVILLEMSHSVDDVVQRNLTGLRNVDVVQCSIDAPPMRKGSVDGIVYCHNVIQHTRSVEDTARALYALTAPGGELVFNCYPLNDEGVMRWLRWNIIYRPLRYLLSRMPFVFTLAYARVMAIFGVVPVFGVILEKMYIVVQGDIPRIKGESILSRFRRKYRTATLNTFDAYGAHQYQHHKREYEIRALLDDLQPDHSKILNVNKYFQRPPPTGCALRVIR